MFLPGNSHGRRSLVGCCPWGHKESDTTEQLHFHFSLFTFMHWRRKWQPTPVFLPGESQGRGSLVGCHLWGRTELETTEATWQQQVDVTGFPGSSSGKDSDCNVGDWGLIPGSARSPGGGHGNLLGILSWRIPWTEEPGGLQSMGSQRVGHDCSSKLMLHVKLWVNLLQECQERIFLATL